MKKPDKIWSKFCFSLVIHTAVPIPCSMAGTGKASLFPAARSSSAKGPYCCLSSCRLMNLVTTRGKNQTACKEGNKAKRMRLPTV